MSEQEMRETGKETYIFSITEHLMISQNFDSEFVHERSLDIQVP